MDQETTLHYVFGLLTSLPKGYDRATNLPDCATKKDQPDGDRVVPVNRRFIRV